jgi:hypothetical protein
LDDVAVLSSKLQKLKSGQAIDSKVLQEVRPELVQSVPESKKLLDRLDEQS